MDGNARAYTLWLGFAARLNVGRVWRRVIAVRCRNLCLNYVPLEMVLQMNKTIDYI